MRSLVVNSYTGVVALNYRKLGVCYLRLIIDRKLQIVVKELWPLQIDRLWMEVFSTSSRATLAGALTKHYHVGLSVISMEVTTGNNVLKRKTLAQRVYAWKSRKCEHWKVRSWRAKCPQSMQNRSFMQKQRLNKSFRGDSKARIQPLIFFFFWRWTTNWMEVN